MDWDNTFLLMNKDKEILSFETKKNKYGSVAFEIIAENDEPRPLGFTDLADWLEKRQAPKHRAHIERLLRVCGCYDLDGFIRVTHALTLNDTFWIKPVNSDLAWDEVSLYQNPFNDTIARIAFEGGMYGEGFSSTSPEFGTDGAYAKCWIRQDDDQDIYLLKRGTSEARNAGLEPYSEYYASQLSGQICKEHIPYDLVMHHGELASSCKLFTTEKTGFIPIWKVLGNTNDPEKLLSYFDSIGSEEAFRRMVVFDALILNTDRHTGNYGVLVDNDSQNALSMAPVFDNNQGLLPYAEEKDFQNIDQYLESRPVRIGVDFNEIAYQMLTPRIKADLNNLKGFTFQMHDRYNLPEERLNQLEKVIDRQIYNVLHDIHLYVPMNIDAQPKFTVKPSAPHSEFIALDNEEKDK